MIQRHFKDVCCDILILGGGIAGAAAALAAAREGASVVLAEKSGRLGGIATNGLVSTLCGCYSSLPGRRKIIGGFRDLLAAELHRTGGILEGVDRDTHRNDTCDPELLACALDTLMQRHDVQLLFSSCVIGADFSERLLRSVEVVNTESGTRCSITPRLAVDASGGASSPAGRPGIHRLGRRRRQTPGCNHGLPHGRRRRRQGSPRHQGRIRAPPRPAGTAMSSGSAATAS